MQWLLSDLCLSLFQELGFNLNQMIVTYSCAPNLSDNMEQNCLSESVDTTVVQTSTLHYNYLAFLVLTYFAYLIAVNTSYEIC
jgi:hypothetical protein